MYCFLRHGVVTCITGVLSLYRCRRDCRSMPSGSSQPWPPSPRHRSRAWRTIFRRRSLGLEGFLQPEGLPPPGSKQTHHSTWHLPSSGTPLLSSRPSSRTDFAACGFRHSVPAVWNSLPRTVLDSPSLTEFSSYFMCNTNCNNNIKWNEIRWFLKVFFTKTCVNLTNFLLGDL